MPLQPHIVSSSPRPVSASCICGQAAVTRLHVRSYAISGRPGHGATGAKWNGPQPCHAQRWNNATQCHGLCTKIWWDTRRFTSCLFNNNPSVPPSWVCVSQPDQKGEIWDREFSKHRFAYTNETSYNWWELIFFPPGLIELQLSLNFFKWRTDWFGVEFQFI